MLFATLFVLSVVLNVALLIIAYRSVNKLIVYEEFAETVQNRLKSILADIRSVDIRGSFEADDEVGIVYRGISQLIQSLSIFITENNIDGAS